MIAGVTLYKTFPHSWPISLKVILCIYVSVSVCVHMYTNDHRRMSQNPGGYGPPDLGARNQTRVPARVACTLNC